MKLYYAAGACSLGVHIVLEWIGAPYEAQAVKPGSPELLKVNPLGAVPALDTGEGWILTQAAAILRHLTRAYPQARLAGGQGVREQAEIDRWLCFFTGDVPSGLLSGVHVAALHHGDRRRLVEGGSRRGAGARAQAFRDHGGSSQG